MGDIRVSSQLLSTEYPCVLGAVCKSFQPPFVWILIIPPHLVGQQVRRWRQHLLHIGQLSGVSEFFSPVWLHCCLALGHPEGRILVLEIDYPNILLVPLRLSCCIHTRLYPADEMAAGIKGQAPILFFQAQQLPSSLHLHYSLLIISPEIQRFLFISF